LHPSHRPIADRLQVLQDRVEAVGQVGDHMVVVERPAAPGVKGGCRTPHEHSPRDQSLEVGGPLQDVLERGGIGSPIMAMLSLQIRRAWQLR
jgi:hypothetical protein